MDFTHVLGNTWVIGAEELIPVYKTDDTHCILMDTGLLEEREGIEATLEKAGLTPVGVLCSHTHIDHCANTRYFQQKYHIPVAMTAEEAGMCSSVLTLKCYFMTIPLDDVIREDECMVHTPDIIMPREDGPFEFLGLTFELLHTPGHSAGHVCIKTPDDVFYLADTLLSWDFLNAKLPYNLSHKAAIKSREKLHGLQCKSFILAHRDVYPPEELEDLIEANNRLLRHRAEDILEVIDEPMTASQINQAACRLYHLFTKRPPHALRFEGNVRFLIEYLVELGALEPICRQGVVFYKPVEGAVIK